jgi:hypothetical protein
MHNSHEIRILIVHYGAKNIQITNIGFLEMTIWYLLVAKRKQGTELEEVTASDKRKM